MRSGLMTGRIEGLCIPNTHATMLTYIVFNPIPAESFLQNEEFFTMYSYLSLWQSFNRWLQQCWWVQNIKLQYISFQNEVSAIRNNVCRAELCLFLHEDINQCKSWVILNMVKGKYQLLREYHIHVLRARRYQYSFTIMNHKDDFKKLPLEVSP